VLHLQVSQHHSTMDITVAGGEVMHIMGEKRESLGIILLK
jgi:hypothetical protein